MSFQCSVGSHGIVKLSFMYRNISGVNDIHCASHNGSSSVLKRVRHVLKLTLSSMSMGRLDNFGYHSAKQSIFEDFEWFFNHCKGIQIISLDPMNVSLVRESNVAT